MKVAITLTVEQLITVRSHIDTWMFQDMYFNEYFIANPVILEFDIPEPEKSWTEAELISAYNTLNWENQNPDILDILSFLENTKSLDHDNR